MSTYLGKATERTNKPQKTAILDLGSKKLFMVQETENAMKQLSEENKSHHHEYFQRNVSRLWLVKEEKRDSGEVKLLSEKVSTENLFPLLPKGEQNVAKWSGSGHFLGF